MNFWLASYAEIKYSLLLYGVPAPASPPGRLCCTTHLTVPGLFYVRIVPFTGALFTLDDESLVIAVSKAFYGTGNGKAMAQQDDAIDEIVAGRLKDFE